MTIREVAIDLRRLSNGWINGKKYTLQELREDITKWMRFDDVYIGKITLNDGEWFFFIGRLPHDQSHYDYYIPETRADEADFFRTENFFKEMAKFQR